MSVPRTLPEAVAVWRATAAVQFACFRPPGEPSAIDAFIAACNLLVGEAERRTRIDLQAHIVYFKEALLALCRDGATVELQLPFNLADSAVNKLEELTARPRARRRRRAGSTNARPLTALETEAAQLVAEHKGNVSAAAQAAGVSRQAMKKRYDKAMQKLGKAGVRKPRTLELPRDRRGQVNL